MGKAAREIKRRKCDRCQTHVTSDAGGMKLHDSLCKRMAALGLIQPGQIERVMVDDD
jgi:hypothetical protein